MYLTHFSEPSNPGDYSTVAGLRTSLRLFFITHIKLYTDIRNYVPTYAPLTIGMG